MKLLGDVNILIAKGYQVILEAKSIFDYSDNEYEYFIKVCNDIKPYAVFISDDFGMMSREKILYYYKMIERLLNSNIYIGFHLHNNKQLAMANAILLLENSQRNIIIDSSIYGMGSGAGLLNTELLIEYLNDNYNAIYRTRDELVHFFEEELFQKGFQIEQEGFLFQEQGLNNRTETTQYYFILQRWRA